MKFVVEGKIEKFLPPKNIEGFPSLSCKIIRLKVEDDFFYVLFTKKNYHLLSKCNNMQIVRFNLQLRVSNWNNNGRKFFNNEVYCNDLTVIKTLDYEKSPIQYNDRHYVVCKTNKKNILRLQLFDMVSEEIIEICHNYEFPNKKLNLNNVFYNMSYGIDLLLILNHYGILSIGNFIKTDIGEGYICQVFPLSFFKNNFLPVERYSFNFILESPREYSKNFEDQMFIKNIVYDEIDYSSYNENQDWDNQSDEFWNQF
ncbi:hypothetical protein M0M57_01400 [Flavobacterium azooxidireducens]|uniref:Uncharacterized protein n=1 Tax=Flavobacterium azooxidireducens TaxID=1871076 RepID=A0ABY4KJA9_9FLAO|nr:hypothetical protein [Flavobacterium azooxidireducens]UPQ79507.1 hypothetical protein M0M57_01400 [Flavobacterium azooxidireducens]